MGTTTRGKLCGWGAASKSVRSRRFYETVLAVSRRVLFIYLQGESFCEVVGFSWTRWGETSGGLLGSSREFVAFDGSKKPVNNHVVNGPALAVHRNPDAKFALLARIRALHALFATICSRRCYHDTIPRMNPYFA